MTDLLKLMLRVWNPETREWLRVRETGPVSAGNGNIVVHVPDHCVTGARIEQQVIRFSVPVRIRTPTTLQPAGGVGPAALPTRWFQTNKRSLFDGCSH